MSSCDKFPEAVTVTIRERERRERRASKMKNDLRRRSFELMPTSCQAVANWK